MRLQISQRLQQAMRNPVNIDLRNMIKSLFDDPRPGWATRVEGRAERYEFAVSGMFVQYEIDESGGETIVIATLYE